MILSQPIEIREASNLTNQLIYLDNNQLLKLIYFLGVSSFNIASKICKRCYRVQDYISARLLGFTPFKIAFLLFRDPDKFAGIQNLFPGPFYMPIAIFRALSALFRVIYNKKKCRIFSRLCQAFVPLFKLFLLFWFPLKLL